MLRFLVVLVVAHGLVTGTIWARTETDRRRLRCRALAGPFVRSVDRLRFAAVPGPVCGLIAGVHRGGSAWGFFRCQPAVDLPATAGKRHRSLGCAGCSGSY
jgi:hypothetical protein